MADRFFITHESALELHRYAILLGRDLPVTQVTSAPQRLHPTQDLQYLEDELERELDGFHLSHPIHHSTLKRTRCGLHFAGHQAQGQYPRYSMLRLTDEIVLSSPALAIAQIASVNSLAFTTLIASEYCGTYWNTGGSTYYNTPPLTTKPRIQLELSRYANIFGAKRARRAMEFAQDNSASPRESQFLLALCMSTSLGGAGIPQPKMNFEVECTDQALRISGRRTLRCDLCWPEARLDVEYQSRAFHEGNEQHVRDSRRANALRAMGFTVMHVTNSELNTLSDFNVIARNIKSHLGLRDRVRVKDYEQKQRALRRELGLPTRFG